LSEILLCFIMAGWMTGYIGKFVNEKIIWLFMWDWLYICPMQPKIKEVDFPPRQRYTIKCWIVHTTYFGTNAFSPKYCYFERYMFLINPLITMYGYGDLNLNLCNFLRIFPISEIWSANLIWIGWRYPNSCVVSFSYP
jgi:hypothetical protein